MATVRELIASISPEMLDNRADACIIVFLDEGMEPMIITNGLAEGALQPTLQFLSEASPKSVSEGSH